MLFYVILSGIPLSMGSAAMVVPNYMLFSILGMNNQWYTLPLIYIAYNIPNVCVDYGRRNARSILRH